MNKLKSQLTIKIFLLVILNDVGDTVAQFFMKKGLIATGVSPVTFSNLVQFAVQNMHSLLLWMGLIVHLLNFFVWIVVLYKVDLSVAMPLGSTSYILVPLVAALLLHENITPLRWIGIILVVCGIYFVSQSKKPVEGSAIL